MQQPEGNLLQPDGSPSFGGGAWAGYPPDVAARLEALAEQQAALRQQIAALPATTLPGLQAKARAAMLWLTPDGDVPVDEDDADARLARSPCRDLNLGEGNVRMQSVPPGRGERSALRPKRLIGV